MKKFLSSLLFTLTVIVTAAPAHADDVCKNLLAKPLVAHGSIAANLDNMFFIKAGTYRLSGSLVNPGRVYIYMMDGDGNYLSGNTYKPDDVYYWNNSSKLWNYAVNTSSFNNTINIATDCYIRIVYDTDNSIANAFQLERGSTTTSYVPYNPLCATCNGTVVVENGESRCVEIKIATTAYNDAQFAPVEEALETAVTTIKDVVANTIVQADAIQNLQDTKQTMPDANGTNGTCPRFRQCLLIETDDGTPQWFPIIDPFKDFFSVVLANNSTIPVVNTQSRYAGDLDLCRTLPQTDEDATSTSVAKCTSVENYKNTATDNPEHGALKQTEWGYEFKAADLADNPNGDSGIVYGISKCISTEIPTPEYGTIEATSTQLNHALWDVRPTTIAEAGDYRRCWCKMTSIVYDGKVFETPSSPWFFDRTSTLAADCANYCARNCLSRTRDEGRYRSVMMNWAVE